MIRQTLDNTTLGSLAPGDGVNLETDIVYVKKPEEPEKAAKKGGFLSSVFASDDVEEEEELDEKDMWKETFEAREVETGLASVIQGVALRHMGPQFPRGSQIDELLRDRVAELRVARRHGRGRSACDGSWSSPDRYR